MSGRRQIEAMAAAGLPQDWQDGFGVVGRSGKLTCLTCGHQGLGNPSGAPAPWQWDCIAGHPDTCPGCGARFRAGGFGRHMASRMECPGPPRAWTRLHHFTARAER